MNMRLTSTGKTFLFKDLTCWLKMSPKLSNQFSRFFLGGLESVSTLYLNGVVSLQSDLDKVRFMRHMSLYAFSVFINMAVLNSAMKAAPVFFGSPSFVSLALATSISISINFFGMRSWVSRAKEYSK